MAAAGKTEEADDSDDDAAVKVAGGFAAVAVEARSWALAVVNSRAAWSSRLKMGWCEEDFASKVIKGEEESEDCRTDQSVSQQALQIVTDG